MNGDEPPRHTRRLWFLVTAVVALIAGPLVLYMIVPVLGVPATAAAGVVALVAITHLGLLAVVLAPIYALLRRRAGR